MSWAISESCTSPRMIHLSHASWHSVLALTIPRRYSRPRSETILSFAPSAPFCLLRRICPNENLFQPDCSNSSLCYETSSLAIGSFSRISHLYPIRSQGSTHLSCRHEWETRWFR